MRKVGERIQEERVKFKQGLQKKFIEKIKDISKLSWKQLADKIDLSEITVRFYLRNEKSTISFSLVKKLLNDYPFTRFEELEKNWIDKILDKNWGQKLSGGLNKKEIKVPARGEDLAELLGIILGDGHLENKTLTITGNSHEKAHYFYLINKIKELFGLNSKIIKLKKQTTMQLKVYSTELINFLKDNNFATGNKIKNKISLPEWIFEKNEFMYGALRGLFDTDGGIYQKQKKYKRAIIEFQTHSPYIRDNLFRLLRSIKFNPSKSSWNVRIQNQEEVLTFFKLIGSSNPKNIVRYNYFIKNGEIPLKERLINEIIALNVEKPFKAALV